ncbi:MAG: glycosyltransferase family 4 protein [Bacteroidales bacterium]|nr:glycosyltransferase family 4 protein [Bacteroidales bacterium]
MISKNKICHITSAHPIDDVRIYHKECLSLVSAGFEVHLLGVIQGKNKNPDLPYTLVDIKNVNFLIRFLILPFKLNKIAKDINADLYHLHDPDLLTLALWLKLKGKKVIFDVHEDVPKQIYAKPYLGKLQKWMLSKFFIFFESFIAKRIDSIVAATPLIFDRFKVKNRKTVNVNNYPILSEFNISDEAYQEKKDVIYAGVIDRNRGIVPLIESLSYTKAKLKIAGFWGRDAFEKEVKQSTNWDKVDFLGFLNRKQIADNYSKSVAGIVTLLPTINYVESLPVKMFEYMAAGIPVVASNFPLWSKIINRINCGICVDPENPEEIGKAVDYLIDNPQESKTMGLNGRNAIIEEFNWQKEAEKLIDLYKDLLKN